MHTSAVEAFKDPKGVKFEEGGQIPISFPAFKEQPHSQMGAVGLYGPDVPGEACLCPEMTVYVEV